jgi:hypothetical protein
MGSIATNKGYIATNKGYIATIAENITTLMQLINELAAAHLRIIAIKDAYASQIYECLIFADLHSSGSAAGC